MSRKLVAASLAALSLAAAPALAQNANVNANNLVNVNLSDTDVLNNIANDLSIDVSQVPVTVQAPIGIAANVCGVAANVLAAQKKTGDAACDAASTSQALNQIVQRQIGG